MTEIISKNENTITLEKYRTVWNGTDGKRESDCGTVY